MSYNVNATFSAEQVRLEGSNPIEMYVINASLTGIDYLYYVNYNQDTYGWVVDSNGDMTSTQVVYTALPISSDFHKSNLSGEIANLKISIPNVDRTMEAYVQNYDYFRGREVYQLTTFGRNLPAGNTGSFLGESGFEDPNSVIKEKMYIDSATSNPKAVTFTCKPKLVIKNIGLPQRMYSRECQWEYLGSECNASTVVASECPRTIDGCTLRDNLSRFGGFPSIPKKYVFI